ncbi:MAG: nucleotide-binding protein [Dehalococcoidia bacterium]|nr:nucleotide-binding protein [Dehalococcoidia bacterium]
MRGKNLLEELTLFFEELKSYQWYRVNYWSKRLSKSQIKDMEDLRDMLVRKAGAFKSIIVELTGKEYLTRFKGEQEQKLDMWFLGLSQLSSSRTHVEALSFCIDVTNQAIGKLGSDIEMGVCDKQGNLVAKVRGGERGTPPKVFIAHGGRTAARDDLEDFLVALGVTPIIVEDQPSEGRSKDKNVEYYLKQCDCAVILATRGDVDGRTGEFIPRGNILIEVGRSLELFPDRMIYLLEEEAKFPTAIDEKVWERFTQENMDKAFIKVAKELKAFGLIRAVRSRKTNV